MRDFYDVYILTKFKEANINPRIFKQALNATSKNRGSTNQIEKAKDILESIKASSKLEKLWRSYTIKNPYAKEIKWDHVISSVTNLLYD